MATVQVSKLGEDRATVVAAGSTTAAPTGMVDGYMRVFRAQGNATIYGIAVTAGWWTLTWNGSYWEAFKASGGLTTTTTTTTAATTTTTTTAATTTTTTAATTTTTTATTSTTTVAPLATYKTNFSTSTVGAAPTGWTSRWSTPATLTTIDLGSGAKALSLSANARTLLSFDAAGTGITDGQTLVKVRSSTGSGVDNLYLTYLRAGGTSSSTAVAIMPLFGTDRASMNMAGYVNGTYTNPIGTGGTGGDAFATATPYATDIWYWVRTAFSGDTVSTRRWRDGDPEPTTWHVQRTGVPITAAGYVGIGASAGNIDCAWFAVTSGAGTTAPAV